ncbi:MAG: arylsulfatase [Bacteroidota bacterium]
MTTTPKIFIGIFCFFVLCLGCQPDQTNDPGPPNIILIMGDDMGYSDLGCYGGEINTPNLDALAANGLRFTQFYNGARCCPTRASLLTGLYAHQAGVGHMMSDRGTPAFQGDLSHNAVTIAEALKGAGYSTYMSGKWHVTPYLPKLGPNPPKDNWPRQRGFDQFFGMITGAGSFYDPRGLARDNEYIVPRDGFYFTNDISDYAIERIEQHQADNPFFMYVSYTAAHWPMHALPEDIAKYKGRYDEGWDVMRAKRVEKMQQMGLIDPQWTINERDSVVEAWTDEVEHREWEIANMEVYAAMVDNMDQGIGRIVDALKAKGQLDNTLIFFLQDNGACAEELEWIAKRPPAEERVPLKDGELQTDMVPLMTRDGKPVRMGPGVMPGPADTYTAYGKAWANASNTPFRLYKHWVHEGGISTPLIVHYPNGFEDRGVFRRHPSHLIDIMATCVDVAGASYPSRYNDNAITPMAGVSLVPAFADQSLNREAIYWEHEGNRAVRMGKWKLISEGNTNRSFLWDKESDLPIEAWELFDMEADRTETNDLSDQHPELVEKMSGMWMAWAKDVGAVPRPN